LFSLKLIKALMQQLKRKKETWCLERIHPLCGGESVNTVAETKKLLFLNQDQQYKDRALKDI